MTALAISFWIAIIPPVVGAIFVPETLGMRQVDFNEEKKEEKIQRALSRDEDGPGGIGNKILSMLSADDHERLHGDYVEMKTSNSSNNGEKIEPKTGYFI
jgi:hypothetical protein